LILDKEPGAQVYFAATKEEQARIGFNDVQEIIKASPDARDIFKLYTKSATYGNSFIKPIGSDSNTSDGFDPSYGIIDEYHAHPTSGMLNVLESGMGARRQPMIDIITTAGFNRQSPCYSETRRSSINILAGITSDESHLALIFSMDEGDDWEDERNWLKPNPNYGISVKPEFLRDRYRKAKNEGGSKEVDFKTKNLNIWTDTERTWIPDDVWMKCNEAVSDDDLNGAPCYAGLDLASTRDICAFVLVFPMSDGRYCVRPYFFIPELSAKERTKKDGVNYDTWVREGLMIETPGNVTDYDYIRDKINELGKQYEIMAIGYDRYNASQLVINLKQDGFKCEPFGQGFGSMSAPTKELERLVYQNQIMHGGNAVLRWMCSNVMIEMNPAADIKISKAKSSEKVDGMVGLVMALGQAMNEDKIENSFEVTMI
jgi:phage terminase large subunit-like protein